MKLVFLSSSVAMGGAERVVTLLTGGLARRGHSVTLITTTTRGDFFVPATNVERVALDLTGQPAGTAIRLRNLPGTLKGLASGLPAFVNELVVRDPDLVVSFQSQLNVLTLAVVRGRWPVVISERTDPAQAHLGVGWRLLRRLCYPHAAAVVSPSQGVDRGLSWLPKRKRLVVHNPVHTKSGGDTLGLPAGLSPGRYVVAVGRMIPDKGFDLLLEVFARVRVGHPDWRLAILGDGPERASLEQRIGRLGLEDVAMLLGPVSEPDSIVRQAGLFAMTSRREGFPNALAEAMACGVPAVSFDCPSGPAELIRQGENGLLLPQGDIEAFANAVSRLIENADLRGRMANAARASVARFELDNILDQWEQIVFPLALERSSDAASA
jgi:glycosyltransferase involved in cell wall biosynthesis